MNTRSITLKTGHVYGWWKILSFAEEKSRIKKSSYWTCICKCGTVKDVCVWALTKGLSLKCSKCNRENNSGKLPKGIAAFNCVYATYKYSAKKRKIPFELTKEEFRVITIQNCHYCDASPSNSRNPTNKTAGVFVYTGIDRKDNNIGYLLSNCLPSCIDCNQAKMDRTYEEFINWIKRICVHRGVC